MRSDEILAVVLDAMSRANMARSQDQRLAISSDAPIFGAGSPLDSLGLVALVIDIEDGFQERGVSLTLSDERAMSQSASPFRNVPSLVSYIATVLATS